MRLEKLRIQNFRSFKDETIHFDSYTCLVGPNGCGKSTVLTALNVFFRNTTSAPTNTATLSEEDFHHRDTAEPIQITLTFKDLSEAAQDELSHYFRQGRLTVTAKAIWNAEAKTADVKQYGVRNVMKAFGPYFKAEEDGALATPLKEIYDGIRADFPDLASATSKPARKAALNAYEESHPELCEPLESETQFYGFTKGANLLARYVQWVYVPAVKDASSEQQEGSKGALKELLDRTIRTKVSFKEPINALRKQVEADYKKIIDAERDALVDLEASMNRRLKDWASPNAMLALDWHYDEDKSISVAEPYARASLGEDRFVGAVSRLGHGMQRSFLVSLLHELGALNAEHGPTLLLGFEEPELYQHPPQAQHMCTVLEELANTTATNAQVIICTHSPYFVSTKGFENVRVVRKHQVEACTFVASTTYDAVVSLLSHALGDVAQKPTAVMAAVEQIMQPSQKELYFSRVAVLVEGLEDIGFIATHLVLTDNWNAFRRLGCHFIVAGCKTNMSRPLAIARELSIPAFAVIDGDTKQNKDADIKKQLRDNRALLSLCGIAHADAMPGQDTYYNNCVIWHTTLEDAVRQEAGDTLWNECCAEARCVHGFGETSKKNKMFVAALTQALYDRGFTSRALTELTNRILAFAEHSSAKTMTPQTTGI